MSGGCVTQGGHAPFDMQEIAKQAIALGMTLEEFDRLDVADIEVAFEGLSRRYEINNEGVIAQLIRQNTFITACYAPFFKSSDKPKKMTDIYRFSHEKDDDKAINTKAYDAMAKYLKSINATA